MTAPLLTTKTPIPPVRAGLVTRPALLRRLDEGLAYNLVLDEADNDPARFTAYLLAALRAALEPAWQDALEEERQGPPQEEVLIRLINQISAIPPAQ